MTFPTPTGAAGSTRSRKTSTTQDSSLLEMYKNLDKKLDSVITKLDKKIDKVIANLSNLDERLKNLETNQQANSRALQQTNTQLKAVEQEQRAQAKSLDYAHAEIADIKTVYCGLQKQMQEISSRLDGIKNEQGIASKPQEKSYQNLLVCGIPETPRENLAAVMSNLAEKMGIKITANDICNIYRTKSKNIYVKFTSELTRDTIYNGRRKLNSDNITTKTLGMQSDAKIYLNEVLDDTQREVFYRARQKRKELRYKFIWTFHGAVYVKKDRESDLVKVTSVEDVNKLD